MLIHSPKELALFLVSQRKKLKLSQSEVCQRVGLKQKTISAIENKPEHIELDTLFRVLAALGLDMKITAKNSMEMTKTTWPEEW